MPITPHTADIVVRDMSKSLAFYRLLGLDIEDTHDDVPQVEFSNPGGMSLSFVLEAMAARAIPGWIEPVGQRITTAFKCDTPAEVDETYAKVTAGGFPGLKEPWDAFWGQRYAMLRDPDGNRVDVFAVLPDAA